MSASIDKDASHYYDCLNLSRLAVTSGMYRILIVTLALASFSLSSGFSASFVQNQLGSDIPEDQLPYHLQYYRVRWKSPQADEAAAAVDVTGDGVYEYLTWYSLPRSNCTFQSAIVCYADPSPANAIFQYNGPLMFSRIESVGFVDVFGGPAKEIILTKAVGDSILLEIYLPGSGKDTSDTVVITAAIGHNLNPPGAWHDIFVTPQAALDLNGDGSKELIYSRSAKPDSAFERGLVAYDIQNDRPLWFLPLADLVRWENFHIVEGLQRDTFFVFCTSATGNRYSTQSGMSSDYAYLMAVDRDGKERWRHTIGSGFGSSDCITSDLDGDGQLEIISTTEAGDPDLPDSIRVAAYDPMSGDIIESSPSLPGSEARLFAIHASPSDLSLIAVVTGRGATTYRLDTKLQPIASVVSVEPEAVGDMNSDGRSELFCPQSNGQTIVVDANLHLIACADKPTDRLTLFESKTTPLAVLPAPYKYYVVSLTKRSITALAYARYKWYLAVIVAAAAVLGLWLFGRWVRRLYLSAAGVPGLERVGSLVVVLSRKGRIVYVNRHELAGPMLAHNAKRPNRMSDIAHFPLRELVERSFRDLYSPIQDQLELTRDGQTVKVAVTVYPRLDHARRFDGKILVAEDVTHRAGWQRKVVLGEAAQRWIHKLKGNLATARLQLDNLKEDPRLSGATADPAFAGYMKAIGGQITQTSETAAKILRFASIGSPNPEPCDLSRLIDQVVEPYRHSHPGRIAVAETPQPALPAIAIDPVQMSEVLDNLLSNAVHATEEHGRVIIGCRWASDLIAEKDDGQVEMVVEDTGVGIAPDDLEKIFTPGYSRSGSTGVGLALVKEIVTNHGGTIGVESRTGQGTRFVIRLPAARRQH